MLERYFALWNKLNRDNHAAQKNLFQNAVLLTIRLVGCILIAGVLIYVIKDIPEGTQIAKIILFFLLIIVAILHAVLYFLELKRTALQSSEAYLHRRVSFCRALQNEFLVAAEKDGLPFNELLPLLQSEAQEEIAKRDEDTKRYSDAVRTFITAGTVAAIVSAIGGIFGNLEGNAEKLATDLFTIAILLSLLSGGAWLLLSQIASKWINNINYLPSKDLMQFISDIKLISILETPNQEQSSTADETRLADDAHQSICGK